MFLVYGEGCGILVRRPQRIGRLGLNFNVAVVETWTGDVLLVGMGKQKEAEAEENDNDRYCDNAERDKVEQGVGRKRAS